MSLLFVCLLIAAPEASAEVQTLRGDVVRGALLELNERQVIVSTPEKKVTIPTSDLQQIRLGAIKSAAKAPAAWVELVDGCELLASDFGVKAGECQLILVGGGEVKLPARALRSVRFQEQTPALAAEWSKIRQRPATSDLAVLRKKERLDFLEGVLQEIDGVAAQFRMDDEVVRISRAKLEGLVFFPPQDKPAAPVALVVGNDGMRFQVQAFSLTDQGLKLSTPSGLQLVRPLASLASLDFAAGKLVYLSDLEPQLAQWTPYFSGGKLSEPLSKLFRPRRNQALLYGETAGDDGALQLRFIGENGVPNIRSFAKGLALHSRSRVVFELPEDFRYLKALAGIDARLGQQGNVRLRIEGDGRELYSASISGNDPPHPIDIELKGVKQLVLIVDFGEQLDVGDYLNLCDGRLVR
ncbi:MAG: NPCBM/NEW2 domain-containing protein [Planctomycetes bacterium]|nr:NPCBM/NEW2 domain-containing protein [Planctomycetota bacterium]